jgi:hypothetical protein
MTLTYESYSFDRPVKGRFQKTPTKLLTTLGRTVGTTWESIQGKEVPVGTVAEIRGTLYDQAYNFLASKAIKVYHKVGTGAYSLVTTIYTDNNGSFVLYYPLPEGVHSFYCEFEGDTQYEGCGG